MISEQAVVIAIKNNETWIETQRKSSCGQCSANKACGTAVLSKVVGKKMATMRAINKIGANVGDTVLVSLNENSLLKGAFMVYMLPLLFMFVFSFVAAFLQQQLSTDGDGLVILFAIAGFVAGLWRVKRFSSSISHDEAYQPVIYKKLLLPGQFVNR